MFLRTFIAVRVPASPPLQQILSQLGDMGRAVKTVAADNLHVTLKFLGDTPEERILEIGELVAVAAAMETVCEVRLVGLGAYPRPERPSVVWVGMEQAELLGRLAAELDAALIQVGFSREARPFQPHLTLARVKARPPHALAELLRQHAATEFGTAQIAAVEFIRSELEPTGSRYTVLRSAPLAPASQ